MKIKLDENFGTRAQQILREAGHEAETVRDENLQGTTDQNLFEVCCREQRCLLTLDLDFSDITRFPPEQSGGIVVIRVPQNPSLSLLENLVRQFLDTLQQMPAEKKLWIVEVGRVRIHQSKEDET
jgi:predicted nuclease of predicted toxin-antitoxin system